MLFSYDPTVGDVGGIVIGASAEVTTSFSFILNSSWIINGFLYKELTSLWNTGTGDYYWYRIEGTCGELKCDEYGVLYPECKRMTFFTAVAARNIGEVCDLLKAPRYTAPVNLKISGIQRYSRPVAKENIIDDECNILEEQEFCQNAKCLDYCIDEDIIVFANLSSRAIEAVYTHDAIGSISIYGSSSFDRYKEYHPDSLLGSIEGDFEFFFRLFFDCTGSFQLSSENTEIICNNYTFFPDSGVEIGGQSSFVAPYAKHDFYLSLNYSGNAIIGRSFNSSSGFELLGESEFFLRHKYNTEGSINLYGILEDYGSPSYFYSSEGGVLASGSATSNFYNLGVVTSLVSFVMSSFDLAAESEDLQYQNTLTIDDATVSPACGCGPLGMSILLKHNFNNSIILNNYFRRNGLQFPEQMSLRYKSEDSSWRSIQHFQGRGRDGVSFEDWTVFFTFACLSDLDVWKFSFIAKSLNKTTNKDLQTKFIIEIPAQLICSDNNISTTIRINIGSGELTIARGEQISVVSPSRPARQRTRRTTATVDGIFNDYLVYYDSLGLFKDSYWLNTPIEININPVARQEMPTTDLQSIF
jgi:hypothetical protein